LFAYYLLNRVIESNSVMDAEEIKSHAKRRASAYRDLANSPLI